MAGVIYLLVDSNEKEVSQWAFVGLHWQPQVWVAIGSTLSGALLNFAFVEGLVIFFWTHAQAGTTVCFEYTDLIFALTTCFETIHSSGENF
jgi:hypothetical protein